MISNDFWERFKNEKIAVNCQTEDEATDFIKQCYENGLKWYKSDIFETNYYEYQTNTCYNYNSNGDLAYGDNRLYKNSNYTIIPYSEINKSIKEEIKMDFNYRGKVFNDPVEYANYILKCAEEDRVKVEKVKKEKLEAEKEERYKELEKAYNEYIEACKTAREKYDNVVRNYINDYKPTLKNLDRYLVDTDISRYFDSLIKSLRSL